jgi:uncharacterized protein YbjT (DUF2867 family)
MKIVVTGSLGHISKPLAKELVKKGNDVVVVSSSEKRKKEIEDLGATAAIGSLEDADFVVNTFNGADAAYCMIPPGNYFDPNLDVAASYREIANNYAKAIELGGVKRVVHLSSIGAHLEKGSGLLIGHHIVEEILRKIPDIGLTHLRPTAFYYNLYGFIPTIKNAGIMAGNYGGDAAESWVSPKDIAVAAAEELATPLEGNNIRYIASDECSTNETARILGEAIGKPELKWVVISDEQMLSGLKEVGMQAGIAEGLVEMYGNRTIYEDYERNKPAVFGQVKMTDFAKEFAAAYNA